MTLCELAGTLEAILDAMHSPLLADIASLNCQARGNAHRSMFAMPECGIGLFVDIGAAYFLSRLPGEMGMYLALTGQRLKGHPSHDL